MCIRDRAQACAVANRIAPEHLELSVADPESWLPEIRHAGAIFMGRYTAEALGDYCAGPNHVLPVSYTHLQLAGVLDYSSGPALREQGGRLIRASQAAELVVDCSAVERSSSVGISLLLAFMRDARKAGKVLSVRALPEDMREIAKVSSLLEILPLQE